MKEHPVAEISITDWKDIRAQMDKYEDSDAGSVMEDQASDADATSASPDEIPLPLAEVPPKESSATPAVLELSMSSDVSKEPEALTTKSYTYKS